MPVVWYQPAWARLGRDPEDGQDAEAKLYRIQVSIDIAAPVERVWRALCDPQEVTAWDSGVFEALDAPPDYPQPGQHVRWRCRGRAFRLLHDRPSEVVEGSSLHSQLSLGPAWMDETYSLNATPAGCRLDLLLDLRLRLPLIGGAVERLYAGADARRGVQVSLAELRRHCETSA